MTNKEINKEVYRLRKDWYAEYYQKNKEKIARRNKEMRENAKAYKELMKKTPNL